MAESARTYQGCPLHKYYTLSNIFQKIIDIISPTDYTTIPIDLVRFKLVVAKKSLYAIRALLELARDFGQNPVNSAEIARKQGVSGRFIEIILNELKNAGFVESRRGSNGGYLLAKKPEDISVLEIINGVEGPISILNESKEDRKARYYGIDSLNALWANLLSEINLTLEKKTLKDLYEEEKAIWDKNINNYII